MRRKAARIAGLLLAALLPAVMTGCWNNRPLTNLAIIIGMGFDYAADGNIRLTSQVVVPSRLGSNAGESATATNADATVNYTAEGKTVFDAVRNMLVKLTRKAYYGQVRLLAFGSGFAGRGVQQVWDFMERDNEFSRTMKVVVVKNDTAEQLFSEKSEIAKLNAIELVDTMNSSSNYGKNVNVESFRVTEQLSRPNTGIVTGLMTLSGTGSLTEDRLDGAAVLKHGKLVGYLDGDETRGYLFAVNQITSTVLVLHNPEEKDGLISIEVIGSTGKTAVSGRNGRLSLSVKVHAFGNLGDEQTQADLFGAGDLAAIEREASALIRSNVLRALKASEKLGSDIFEFNDLLYRTDYPAYRKIAPRWEEAYREAQVSVSVSFRLDRTGLITKPAYNR